MKNFKFLLVLLLFSTLFPEKAIAITPTQERWIQVSKKTSKVSDPYVFFENNPVNIQDI